MQKEICDMNMDVDQMAETVEAAEIEVLDGNEIDMADEGEVIVETEESKTLRENVQRLLTAVNETYWCLAENLSIVSNGKHYKAWGYSSFEQYLAEECGLKRGKGYALAKIFNYFNNQLKESFVGQDDKYNTLMDVVKQVGWAKARRLATDKIIKPDNVDLIIDKAQKLSLDELEAWCKAEFKALPEPEQDDSDSDNNVKLVRKNFQLTLYQLETVDDAIHKALATMREGATPSSAIALIAGDFLQSATDVSTGGNRKENIAHLIGKMERLFGISLIAYDDKEDDILFGEENLSKVAESIEKQDEDSGDIG